MFQPIGESSLCFGPIIITYKIKKLAFLLGKGAYDGVLVLQQIFIVNIVCVFNKRGYSQYSYSVTFGCLQVLSHGAEADCSTLFTKQLYMVLSSLTQLMIVGKVKYIGPQVKLYLQHQQKSCDI